MDEGLLCVNRKGLLQSQHSRLVLTIKIAWPSLVLRDDVIVACALEWFPRQTARAPKLDGQLHCKNLTVNVEGNGFETQDQDSHPNANMNAATSRSKTVRHDRKLQVEIACGLAGLTFKKLLYSEK